MGLWFPPVNWSSGPLRLQAEAEERAKAGAREGGARQLREAESRADAAEEAVAELRLTLERQQAAFALR